VTSSLDGRDGSLDPELTQASQTTALAKATIGPYRLLQLVGEGGMGEVWLAEQVRPVHRQVALKIIKAGMDTAQVIARFEAERQALALMDHPAIARVFDAGATTQGRPYFVMEYVRGESITSYVTRHKLSIPDRIDLFVQMCEGVQHAHQKGIIHRDLKPSNILVTLQNDRPVPKIIDFGVAKAVTHSLTERTLYTELGALVGTPEYMSPEQAELSGVDIDTRTDVYALGVVLYELLTGILPFELRERSLDEIRRTIREVDPPRPSIKVTTSVDSVGPSTSSGDAARIASQLRGDLDWITMKALEKDRTRRYATIGELAADLQRHLDNQPVLASPPSVVYRADKFVRRHRAGAAVAAGVLLLLLGFAITMTMQARRIARERDRANQEAEVSRRVQDFLTGLFQVASPSEARGSSITAREILDQGAKRIDTELGAQPEVQAQLMHTMSSVYRGLGLFGHAQTLLERALETRRRVLGPEHPDTLRSINLLADLYRNQGRLNEAEKLLRADLDVLGRTLGPDDIETFKATNTLARILARTGGSPEEALKLLEDALPRERRAFGPEHEVTIASTFELAITYDALGRGKEAEKLYGDVVAARRRVLGPEHPLTLFSMYVQAGRLAGDHRYQEAEHLYGEVLETQRRILGSEHQDTLHTMLGLGATYFNEHRYTDADKVYDEALSVARRVPNNPVIAMLFYNRACWAAIQSRRQESLADLKQAVDHGFRRADEMATDEDLKSLHGDPRFNAILAEVTRLAAAK